MQSTRWRGSSGKKGKTWPTAAPLESEKVSAVRGRARESNLELASHPSPRDADSVPYRVRMRPLAKPFRVRKRVSLTSWTLPSNEVLRGDELRTQRTRLSGF